MNVLTSLVIEVTGVLGGRSLVRANGNDDEPRPFCLGCSVPWLAQASFPAPPAPLKRLPAIGVAFTRLPFCFPRPGAGGGGGGRFDVRERPRPGVQGAIPLSCIGLCDCVLKCVFSPASMRPMSPQSLRVSPPLFLLSANGDGSAEARVGFLPPPGRFRGTPGAASARGGTRGAAAGVPGRGCPVLPAGLGRRRGVVSGAVVERRRSPAAAAAAAGVCRGGLRGAFVLLLRDTLARFRRRGHAGSVRTRRRTAAVGGTAPDPHGTLLTPGALNLHPPCSRPSASAALAETPQHRLSTFPQAYRGSDWERLSRLLQEFDDAVAARRVHEESVREAAAAGRASGLTFWQDGGGTLPPAAGAGEGRAPAQRGFGVFGGEAAAGGGGAGAGADRSRQKGKQASTSSGIGEQGAGVSSSSAAAAAAAGAGRRGVAPLPPSDSDSD